MTENKHGQTKKKSPNNNPAWNSLRKMCYKHMLFTQDNKSIDLTKYSFCLGIDKYVVDGKYTSREDGLRRTALAIISLQRFVHVSIWDIRKLFQI